MNNKSFDKMLQIFFILLLFINFFIFGQDKKNDDTIKLREEIISVYKTGGEQALLDFYKKNRAKITNRFIVDFAELVVRECKERLPEICKILAAESKDKKTLADVYCKMGEYYRLITNNKKALDHLEKALYFYQNLNDAVGQGEVYLQKGNIYSFKLDRDKAQEMYDKAFSFFEKAKNSQGKGKVYKKKGNIYYSLGNFREANVLYEKALSIFEKEGYIIGQGNVYQSKASILLLTGQKDKAIEMFDKAMTFYEKDGDPLSLGNIHLRKGYIYSYSCDFEEALEEYEKALSCYEKAKHIKGKGNVYMGRGDIHSKKGDYSKAFDAYDKALQFFVEARDLGGQGKVYLVKGQIYFNKGDNERAEKLYEKARPLLEKLANPIDQGNFFLLKGYTSWRYGDNKKAENSYNKALALYKKVGEPISMGNAYLGKGLISFLNGDKSKALDSYNKALTFFKISGNPIGLGNIYQCLGEIYLYNNDSLKALEMYQEAITSFLKAMNSHGFGAVQLRRGNIFLQTGNFSKARDTIKKGLPSLEKYGDIQNQGNFYLIRGETYYYAGENSLALKMYEKAKRLYEESKDVRGQGTIFIRKGDIFFRTGDFKKALEMYDNAIPIFEKAGAMINQAVIFRSKGDIYFRIGDNSKALEMYNKALDIDTKFGDQVSEASTLCRKARLLAKQKKKDQALALYEEVISRIEKIRHQTGLSSLKVSFIKYAYEEHEEATLYFLENNNYKKGFIYAESMRARTFLDRIGEGLAPLEKGLKPEFKEKRNELIAKLSNLSKQMQETGGDEVKKLAECKDQYKKVEDEFEELLIKIRLDNPLYASVRYPVPVSVKELRKNVLKKGEIILRYFISPDTTYVFLISKKSFKVVPITIKAEKIKSHVNLFLEAAENKTGDVELYGKVLCRKLFKPIEEKLKKNYDIIIIPDGYLEKIPFEALIVDENEFGKSVYLTEKYRVKYVQSASVLSVLRKHYHRDRETNSFIGFGDPVYDYEKYANVSVGQDKPVSTPEKTKETNPIAVGQTEPGDSLEQEESGDMDIEDEVKEIHRGRYERAGGKLPRLIGSGKEVREIAKLFEKKEQKTVSYLRDQAMEEKAKSTNLKEFDFIHFACHGLLNDEFQSLVLSQDIPGAKDDGYFTLNEIMNCDYNAKLVVLSACETGAGKMEKGEGVTGLTRAVMYAGTPAVVASLWKVDDNAARELMVNFYTNMLEKNMDKPEALRQAKLDLIKSNDYSSPLSWSAFVLYGE